MDFILSIPGGSEVKVSACNVGDLGSTPRSGISPGEGNGNPLQYSCLDNPMNGGPWWATVHGVAKSWTRLSNLTYALCMMLLTTVSNLFFSTLDIVRVYWYTQSLSDRSLKADWCQTDPYCSYKVDLLKLYVGFYIDLFQLKIMFTFFKLA